MKVSKRQAKELGLVTPPKEKRKRVRGVKPPTPPKVLPSTGTAERVTLPIPPSANHLYPTNRQGRRYMSGEYHDWREACHPTIRTMRAAQRYPVVVHIRLTGQVRNMGRDVANLEKATTDSLVSCGVLIDDKLKCVRGVYPHYEPDDGPERIEVWFVEPESVG